MSIKLLCTKKAIQHLSVVPGVVYVYTSSIFIQLFQKWLS